MDISILTAGSPYGKYMSVKVFALYTRAVTLVFVHGDKDRAVERILRVTGGESLGLVVVFLLCLLTMHKARQKVQRRPSQSGFSQVFHLLVRSENRDLMSGLGPPSKVGRRDSGVF